MMSGICWACVFKISNYHFTHFFADNLYLRPFHLISQQMSWEAGDYGCSDTHSGETEGTLTLIAWVERHVTSTKDAKLLTD